MWISIKRLIAVAGAVIACLALLPAVLIATAQSQPVTPTPIPTASSVPAVTPTADIGATPEPEAEPIDIPKVHIIQPGETLVSIAAVYSTTAELIQTLNGIADPSLIFAGQEIVIPGATGDALPTVYTVAFGDTLDGIAARYNTTPDSIAAAAGLPTDRLFVGQAIPLISRTGSVSPLDLTGVPHLVTAGETLLTLAVTYNVSADAILEANNLETRRLYPGQRLRIPTEGVYEPLAGRWTSVDVQPVRLAQGTTASIKVTHLDSGQPTGALIGTDGVARPLLFSTSSNEESGVHTALIGLDAFTPPGVYTLQLSGIGDVRPWETIEQPVLVASAGYGLQQITLDPSLNALTEPEVRSTEDAFLDDIFVASLPDPLWDGQFVRPVSTTIVTAGYGDSRSYNDGPIITFHTGIDFAGTIGTPIFAPADGIVAYVGELELRGNAVILDHGLGVMTAYYHLSEIDVALGDPVTAGQTIAKGGSTGLSTGPHLHWDVRVWGAAVDPQAWLDNVYP